MPEILAPKPASSWPRPLWPGSLHSPLTPTPHPWAVGHRAGEGAEAELQACSRNSFLSHPLERGAVSASPSSRDYQELKIPTQIERDVRESCSQTALLLSPLFCGFPGCHLNPSPKNSGMVSNNLIPLNLMF